MSVYCVLRPSSSVMRLTETTRPFRNSRFRMRCPVMLSSPGSSQVRVTASGVAWADSPVGFRGTFGASWALVMALPARTVAAMMAAPRTAASVGFRRGTTPSSRLFWEDCATRAGG